MTNSELKDKYGVWWSLIGSTEGPEYCCCCERLRWQTPEHEPGCLWTQTEERIDDNG
jgi:hypothetical protein